MLFAILETEKLQKNKRLRKIHNQFGQHNHQRTAQRQTAKRFCEPHAIVFPRTLFHVKQCRMTANGRGNLQDEK